MSDPKKKQVPEQRQSPPARPAKGKPKVRVIHGSASVDPSKQKPPKIRVVGPDRLTTEEMKQRFASNLDRLIGLLGMTRKQAAREIGVPYKLVRRLVSEGVSRTDERSEDDVAKIAAFFVLPDVEDLWRADLLRLVLDSNGPGDFINKFRPRLLAERERRLAEVRLGVQDELGLLSRALGFSDAQPPALTGPYAEQVATILASPRAESFKQVIAAYHELVTLLANDPDEGQAAAKSSARA